MQQQQRWKMIWYDVGRHYVSWLGLVRGERELSRELWAQRSGMLFEMGILICESGIHFSPNQAVKLAAQLTMIVCILPSTRPMRTMNDEWRFEKLSSSSIDWSYNQLDWSTLFEPNRSKTGLESRRQIEIRLRRQNLKTEVKPMKTNNMATIGKLSWSSIDWYRHYHYYQN